MDLWEQIKNDKDLQALLMQECDICFYKQLQEVQFLENNENYSMQAKAFAHDASGGEFVLLQDESVGFIGSEGEVGRIAESLAELLTFLIYTGNLFDFNCKKLYERESLLKAFCEGYLSRIREDYRKDYKDWDKIRVGIGRRTVSSLSSGAVSGCSNAVL